jgi:PIN domain nuclease of toxin-antitoxin system
MKCLLDTHAFLWSVFDPRLLGKKAAPVIRNPNNSVSVSVVSFWEISLKHSVGKLELENVAPEDFPKIAARAGFEILPLTASEAASCHRLPRLEHRDPFDRLIVWQAIDRKLVLISADSSISAYRSAGLKVLW